MSKIKDGLSMVWNLLDGHKTKIGTAIVFVGGGLYAIKVIGKETFDMIVLFGGAISGVGLTHAFYKTFLKGE